MLAAHCACYVVRGPLKTLHCGALFVPERLGYFTASTTFKVTLSRQEGHGSCKDRPCPSKALHAALVVECAFVDDLGTCAPPRESSCSRLASRLPVGFVTSSPPIIFPLVLLRLFALACPRCLYHADWRSGRCLCRGVITVMLKVRLHNSQILLRGLAIQSPPTACNRFPTIAIPTIAVPTTRQARLRSVSSTSLEHLEVARCCTRT